MDIDFCDVCESEISGEILATACAALLLMCEKCMAEHVKTCRPCAAFH